MCAARSEPDDDEADDADDELEIELRSPAAVADRLIALAATGRRALLERGLPDADWDEDEDDPDDRPEDAETERFDLVAWLREEGVWSALSGDERALLETPMGRLDDDDPVRASWSGEAIVALAWAAGLLPILPPFDRPADPRQVVAAVPEPWDKTGPFRAGLRLRSEEDAAAGRELAELWAWRIGVERLRRKASHRDVRDLEDAIEETAREAHAVGHLPSLAGGDFAVSGKPVLALPANQLDDVELVASERLRALNWLCGFGQSWDDAPGEP